MKFKSVVVALASLGALVIGAGPGAANDLTTSAAAGAAKSSVPMATTDYQSGYVTTQGRRGGGGGFSRGGRGGGFARGGGRRNNFGRNVGIGVGALVLGGIIASQSARASGGNSCGRWEYQCNNGAGWACRNLDRHC